MDQFMGEDGVIGLEGVEACEMRHAHPILAWQITGDVAAVSDVGADGAEEMFGARVAHGLGERLRRRIAGLQTVDLLEVEDGVALQEDGASGVSGAVVVGRSRVFAR